MAARHATKLICCVLLGCYAAALPSCNRRADLRQAKPAETNGEVVREVQAPATKARFVDVAIEVGIDFTARNGRERGERAIIESLGVGVALLDYDRDARLDLFIPGGGDFPAEGGMSGRLCALYRNGLATGFQAVAADAGIADAPHYAHGAIAADYDNDGWTDVLLTGFGGVVLFHNQGDGTFQDVTADVGMSANRWSTSAAWGDVNQDGALDLYLVNYVDWSLAKHPVCEVDGHREVCAPGQFNALTDQFFLAHGDGTFREAGEEIGLVEGGKGLAILAGDVDLDGDLDYYVGNDTTANFLYVNDGAGRLAEQGLVAGVALNEQAQADGSMGVDLGDFNGDGLPDLWVANYEDQSFALYRNEGECCFEHISRQTGISQVRGVHVGFGTVFFDFDQDGDEDIFAANGHVMYAPANAPYAQKPLLFENHERRFHNVAALAGVYMDSPHVGRGVAVGDVDGDGDLDLAVAHTNEPVAILSNESETPGQWLKLRLVGRSCNRDAIGTHVVLRHNGRSQTRQVKGGASYLSTNDTILHFGLGRQSRIDEVEINWPGGRKQLLRDVPSNEVLTVVEPL